MGVRRVLTLGILVVAACGSFREGNGTAPGPADADASDATSTADSAALDAPIVDAGDTCGHMFCADFENDPLTNGFTEAKNEDRIVFAGVDAMPQSKHALRTMLPEATYSNRSSYFRNIIAGSAAKSATLSFTLRVVKAPAPGEGNVQVATIGWGAAAGSHDKYSEVQVRLGASWIEAKRDEEDADVYETKVPFTGGWNQVSVVLTFQPSNVVTVVATVNGTPTLAKTFTSEQPPDDVDIGVGLPGVDGTFASQVSFDIDDVTFDVVK